MARTIYPPPASDAKEPDNIANLNLTRLLARLEQHILSSSADLKLLRQSRYHRARVGANVDYAQSLLIQLERSLPKIKAPEHRHGQQTDLAKKRNALKLIKDRLDLITEEAEAVDVVTSEDGKRKIFNEEYADDEDEDEDDEDAEDLLIDTPDQSSTGEDVREEEREELLRSKMVKGTEIAASEPSGSTTTASTLRNRHPSSTLTPTSAPTTTALPISTSASTSTFPLPSTSPLPSSSPSQFPADTDTNPQIHNTEETLTSQRVEQESLTDSLVALAGELKASSQAFQSSLSAEKSILSRAVEGLDRNVSGMDAAGKRVGILRRMSEGRGWWGRMLLYVWILGLWVVAVGIVFLGPKLRF